MAGVVDVGRRVLPNRILVERLEFNVVLAEQVLIFAEAVQQLSFGNLRFLRRGLSVAGTHEAFDLMQLAQGNLRLHLILRCWQSTHASTRCGFRDWEDGGDVIGLLCSDACHAADMTALSTPVLWNGESCGLSRGFVVSD